MKRVFSFLLFVVWPILGFVMPALADDPDAFSPVVSYQFSESLNHIPGQPNIFSTPVSYQYSQSLEGLPEQPSIFSPTVSYVFSDWPGDTNLLFQSSHNVSYFFPIGSGSVVIRVPPASQFVRLGSNATFSVVADGQGPLFYQWRFNGINRVGSTDSTLTISNVGSPHWGKYSVAVSNSFGHVTSQEATLAVLTEPASASGVMPVQPSYSPVSPPAPGKDSLIVVTHGWQIFPLSPDVNFMSQMVADIRNRVPGNWQVESYDWVEKAWTLKWTKAFFNAFEEGRNLGKQVTARNWNHVHLIGHSAGSALIQTALETIKAKSPTTTVHLTFLDAYVGPGDAFRNVYGLGADWADSYYAIDFATGSVTEGRLEKTYSVNVTEVDPEKQRKDAFCSSQGPSVACGVQALSSHGWPIDFYLRTITDTTFGEGFGFPLSKESGGWDNARNTFPPGNSPPWTVGTGITVVPQCTIPARTDFTLDVSLRPSLFSQTAIVQITGQGIDMRTAYSTPSTSSSKASSSSAGGDSNLPAWLSVGLTITNTVNFVSFDGQFASDTNASGLLTVYWNTNLIGSIDETVALTGTRRYFFMLPETISKGDHVLSFRLDSFTNVVSGIAITNIGTGYFGITNPIVLSLIVTNETPIFSLTAEAGLNYIVESSINLVDWSSVAILVNTNGSVQFWDSTFTSASRRFYRAMLP